MRLNTADLPAALGRNAPCWCGSGKKSQYCHARPGAFVSAGRVSTLREVPESIERPPYLVAGASLKARAARDRADRMRRTGRLAADIARAAALFVRPGVTTDQVDELCHTLAVEAGAYPSPLGYAPNGVPFPKSVCTSVNEVICHGIPDSRPLREGDIVSIDVTVYREGVHGDTCVTVGVGEIDRRSAQLVDVTRRALEEAISVVRPGSPLNAIGRAVQAVAEPAGFGVVRDFVGHGVGEEFHGSPQVPHYYAENMWEVARPGMTFTIEPMVTAGAYQVAMWPDGWTAVTADRSRCAQFEHSLLVTDDGAEVLTAPADKEGHPYWAPRLTTPSLPDDGAGRGPAREDGDGA
jgi:methionyl aminopeptidase